MKKHPKENAEDRKRLAENLDVTFASAAGAMSLKTELLECCEWEEQLAHDILHNFADTIEDLASYIKYDDSLELNDLENLVKLNMKVQTTNEQFSVLMKMFKLEAVEQIKRHVLQNSDKSKN